MGAVIGIDFDNTLIDYDGVFGQVALACDLIKPGVSWTKTDIRDAIRSRPKGEIAWQQIQAEVYGPAIERAILPRGVVEFFQMCRQSNAKIFIVSHKTQFANQDTHCRYNLHTQAMTWMKNQGFFSTKKWGIQPDQVFFESTRRDKLKRIESLQCDHFIDDLPEVFKHPAFPDRTCKVLYAPHGIGDNVSGITMLSSWFDIQSYIF